MKIQLLAIVLVSSLTILAIAQDPYSIESLVLEGDSIPTIGLVEFVENGAINDHGDTYVEVNTDFADTEQDGVLLFNNVPLVQEGVIGGISAPLGVFVDSFDSVTINNNGNGGFNFFLDPLPGNEDSGLYINTTLVVQESDFSAAEDFSPNTPFIGFFDAKINDEDRLMVIASIDDPAINSSVDRAVMLIDESLQVVVAKEGDILAGQTEAVEDFGTGPHESAYNNSGQVLFIAELTGDASSDHAIYLDQTLIAQEGSPSPVAGQSYETLDFRSMDLNDHGEVVFKANLSGDTGSDDVIIKNGSVLVREGDPAPGGFVFTGFGSSNGPIKIGNSGDVLWFGEWDDPNTNQNSGLFLNDELIVQVGVSMVDGMVIESLASFTDQFSMSSSGQWIIFEAMLEGGVNGAFTIFVDSGLLGDVNCDGTVDILDVAPFVDLIVNGGFSEKADINGDGTVDLLDVGAFVQLIVGG